MWYGGGIGLSVGRFVIMCALFVGVGGMGPLTTVKIIGAVSEFVLNKKTFRVGGIVASGKIVRLYSTVKWTGCAEVTRRVLCSRDPLRITKSIQRMKGGCQWMEIGRTLILGIVEDDDKRPIWGCMIQDFIEDAM
jgi:hypothetical protein